MYGGNRNDSFIYQDQIKNDKFLKNNKNKKYFMADKGYDSKDIKIKMSNMGYINVIPQNKRRFKTQINWFHLNNIK